LATFCKCFGPAELYFCSFAATCLFSALALDPLQAYSSEASNLVTIDYWSAALNQRTKEM